MEISIKFWIDIFNPKFNRFISNPRTRDKQLAYELENDS